MGPEDVRLDIKFCGGCLSAIHHPPDPKTGEHTFGGYSDQIVVHEHFALRIPDALSLEKAAPILCAGVTTWSPLRHWNIGTGHVVGVAGMGGLGHMAIQLAKARGAQRVVALTTSPDKADAALPLGADEVVAMSDPDEVAAHAGSLAFLLATIPTAFDMKPHLSLVRHDGTFVTVGMLEPSPPARIDFVPVTMTRLTIAGSLIGSAAESQEVLDFCADHGIGPDVQVIPDPANGLAPGDPARMAAAMTASVDQEPAPLRLILGSDALRNTLATLHQRIAGFEAQTELAASTDIPPGN